MFIRCAVLALFFVGAGNASAAPVFESDPVITQNPNPAVPLAAILEFGAEDAVKTVVSIDDGERQWDIAFDRIPSEGAPLPILGMRAAREHTFEIAVFDSEGAKQVWPKTLRFTTPPLPQDRYQWPDFAVVASNPERMEPGITILSLRRALNVRPQDRDQAQQNFVVKYGVLVGIDNEGEVVWYYQSENRAAGIDRLANGNLIFHLASFETIEMDLLGNVVNRWYAEKRPRGPAKDPNAIPIKGMQTLHHQPHETKDGTFLSFSANWRVIEDWYTNEFDPEPRKDQQVMGDTIIEFDKQGRVVWSWNTFDYLDTDMIGYEAFNPYWVTRGFPDTWDWSHGNGVSHDERDDSVVASFKLLDAIIKVDKKSKDIKWIFGDHYGWKGELADKLLTPVGDDFRWTWHQHNPRWTDAGTLLVFNNNRGQAKPFDGRPHASFAETYSYSAEYEIDEENMTVRQLWVSEPEMNDDTCYSMAMSEAHRLPQTGNILEVHAMCQRAEGRDVGSDVWDRSKVYLSEIPHGGRVREYSRAQPAEVLFELDFKDPHNVLNWQVYGGFKTPSFYLD